MKLNRMERRNKELEERNAELYKEVVWYRKSEEESIAGVCRRDAGLDTNDEREKRKAGFLKDDNC